MRRHNTVLSFLATTTLVFFSASISLTPAIAEAKPPRKKKDRTPGKGKLAVFSLAKGAQLELTPVGVPNARTRKLRLPLPEPLQLDPGKYNVRVYKRGYTEVVETIEIKAGATQEFEADLIAFAGIVKITANVAGAQVAVDGKLAGNVPFDKDVPAGKHEILVTKKGFKPFKQTLNVVAGKEMTINVTLNKAPEIKIEEKGGIHTKWWFWTIIGVVAAGGLATGLALGLREPDTVTPDASSVLQLK